jgi:hypothetical protein
VKKYWSNNNLEDYFKTTIVKQSSILFPNDLVQTPTGKIYSRATQKIAHFSPILEFKAFTELYWSWNNGPIGTTVQPMNQ